MQSMDHDVETMTSLQLLASEDMALQEKEKVAYAGEGAPPRLPLQPFFAGSWDGDRKDWNGDVGIGFRALKDFRIVALGRHIPDGARRLQDAVSVTLWSVETKKALAVVQVGPDSFVEGKYSWVPVIAPGVVVTKGTEYRLTQECFLDMNDTWYDGTVDERDLPAKAATEYVIFEGGVNTSGFGYPVNENPGYIEGKIMKLRRPGIVNFKMQFLPVSLDDDIYNLDRKNGSIRSVVQMAFLMVSLWFALF